MLNNIVNYAVRGLILVLGILLVSGYFDKVSEMGSMFRVLGVIMILWGVYRIIMYYITSKRYRNDDD